jgi:NADPH-dependent 2,4-dienoyl-CoA reductase/sulfur reductase-like enzyme/rhodanese-related sulfurtransferase
MPGPNKELAKKKIVIVGGVAGGMSAAARARRLSEDSEIIIFERSGYVSFANCGLPYYLGREIASHDDLILQTPQSLKQRFNLDVRVHHEVIDIDPSAKCVTVKTSTGVTFKESYDELILAVGAAPVRPAVQGANLPGVFTMRTVEDIDAIESWIQEKNPIHAVIAGGGFIGLETAEQLACRGLRVTLLAMEQVLRPLDPEMVAPIHKELLRNNVQLVLKPVKDFHPPAEHKQDGSEPKSCWVIAENSEPIPADLVILGLGVRPDIKLARKAGLEIGELGGIRVDGFMRTSAPSVWAVGDAIEVRQPVSDKWARIALGGPANRQGRLAADNIFGAGATYGGTLGTFILRVFELTVAATGLNEEQARSAGIPYETIHVHPSQHAGYFPGAEKLTIKIIFARETGKLLGAQIIGKDGVDKRIDVLATALKAGMTVEDLSELELAYAPPFGSAKDAVNLAGMVGKNVRTGLIEQIQWNELSELAADKFCLLDVRSKGERAKGFIPGSIHIPLPDLRQRLSEIPANKTVIVSCQSGQRSYYGARLLAQKGLRVRNLSGGYLTWRTAMDLRESKKVQATI